MHSINVFNLFSKLLVERLEILPQHTIFGMPNGTLFWVSLANTKPKTWATGNVRKRRKLRRHAWKDGGELVLNPLSSPTWEK